MRRSFRSRLFLFVVFFLGFYAVYSLYHQYFHSKRDPEGEAAFEKAKKLSIPILEKTDLCLSKQIDLIFVIISMNSHVIERESIRETWGSVEHLHGVESKRLFIIGYDPNGNFYSELVQEFQNKKDLLYLPIDDYQPTRKEISAYQWLEKYCSNVTFTFKSEDDLFVNSILLHELVRELQTNPNQFQNRYLYNSSLDSLFLAHINPSANTFLFGWAFQPGKPERSENNSAYYVSYREYSKDLYPRYCSGFGYLMNSKTRNLIAHESLNDREPFRFSDIYITGMIPERLNFICDILPFSYHQGTTEKCIQLIKQNNKRGKDASTPPLIVCSTGRHIAQNTFSDYYRIWTVLKYVYSEN